MCRKKPLVSCLEVKDAYRITDQSDGQEEDIYLGIDSQTKDESALSKRLPMKICRHRDPEFLQ